MTRIKTKYNPGDIVKILSTGKGESYHGLEPYSYGKIIKVIPERNSALVEGRDVTSPKTPKLIQSEVLFIKLKFVKHYVETIEMEERLEYLRSMAHSTSAKKEKPPFERGDYVLIVSAGSKNKIHGIPVGHRVEVLKVRLKKEEMIYVEYQGKQVPVSMYYVKLDTKRAKFYSKPRKNETPGYISKKRNLSREDPV